MTTLGIVKRKIARADAQAVAALAQFGVATIHEAMGRTGLMKPYMRLTRAPWRRAWPSSS